MKTTDGETSDLLGRVRVAAPCPTQWEAMEGGERVRFCRQCDLHVYNLSAMRRAEAEALVARTEGRLCARFYRRADGTILTRDCPTGLAALRRRVSRRAAAVLAAVAGLWAAAGAQTPTPHGQKGEPSAAAREGEQSLKISRRPTPAGERPSVSGVVLDPTAAALPYARVTLTNEQTKEESRATTDAGGAFSLPLAAPGSYTLRLAADAFKTYEATKVAVGAGESLRVDLSMALDPDAAVVGIVITDLPLLRPVTTEGLKTVFDMKTVRDLPLP